MSPVVWYAIIFTVAVYSLRIYLYYRFRHYIHAYEIEKKSATLYRQALVKKNTQIWELFDDLLDKFSGVKDGPTSALIRFETSLDDDGVRCAVQLLKSAGYQVTLCEPGLLEYAPGGVVNFQ